MNPEKHPPQDNDDEELGKGGPSPRRNSTLNLTGMGARIAVTAIVVGLMALIISYFMRSPTEGALAGTEAQSVQITMEPTWTIELPPELATVTPEASSTPPPPEPTPEPTPEAPSILVVGGNGSVTGTGSDGVNMRQGDGIDYPVLETIAEGTVFELIGGPSEADGYSWWQIRLDNGTEGWVAQDFIAP